MSEPEDEVLRVAEMFGDLARSFARERDYDGLQKRIVELAVDSLPGCEEAGISLVQSRHVRTRVNTGTLPQQIDDIQNEVGEGPCIDAIRDHEVFQTGDLAAETRWTAFPARAHAATGVRSILSFRLYVDDETIGALNLYSRQADAFDEHELAIGAVFAAHAAVALSAAGREEDLERKAFTRDAIGQAKGILMAQSGIDDAAAFDLLRRASQRLNQKLSAVAQEVVDKHGPPAS